MKQLKELRLSGRVAPAPEEEGRRVPPLVPSEEERAAYAAALAQPKTAMLVTHKGMELYGKDIKKMLPMEWLNDELINLYVRLLQERDSAARGADNGTPLCHFFNSFFMNKLYKDDKNYTYNYANVQRWTKPNRLKSGGQASATILDCNQIIVPVNQGNMHWVCAVADLKKKQFVLYDSLRVSIFGE